MPITLYTLPDLPYDYSALEPHYSAQLLALHHDTHHAAYVTGANAVLETLAAARLQRDFAGINQWQKSLAFYVSGHILHSLQWCNLSPHGGGLPDRSVVQLFRQCFGSYAFKCQMTTAALGLQGSGWAVLAWEPVGRQLIVEQVYDHQGNLAIGALPLLVLDMWEHAYYPQYQSEKADWVTAFWELVDWKDVAQRLDHVRSLDLRGAHWIDRPAA